MQDCEICGRQADTLYEISLDGAQMLVCERCAKGKDVIRSFGEERESKATNIREASSGPTQEEIVEDFGERIRKAREAMGLPLKVLAEKIAEKESTLDRIEKQKTLPTEKTRMKLEKELGIKLISRVANEGKIVSMKKNEPLTLWDLAKKEEDEKSGE